MLIKKIGLIPFALSAMFLSMSTYSIADDDFLTIDQILNQADGFKKVDSPNRSIREPNKKGGLIGIANARDNGGLIKGLGPSRSNDVYEGGDDDVDEGEEDSETVDDIKYSDFNAKRIEGFNGFVVGYKDGVPIMCPNPDPDDIHPDVEFNDGERPTISVPIKFRNFNMTISSFNKRMIADDMVIDKDFIVSYPYEADAYRDREEIINLYNELKMKRAYAYKNISGNLDNFSRVDRKIVENARTTENIFESYHTGQDFIIQILEIDDKNKRIKLKLDYSQRNATSYVTERYDVSDTEFKNITLPVIESKATTKTFWIPIKNREEVKVMIDNFDFIKVKFNNYEYDAARVEIDDLDKIAKINEAKRLLEVKRLEEEEARIMRKKLEYFDEVEDAIKKF